MAGERQPGGRAPAPGELALVQAFINSHYDLEFDHGADLLGTPTALARWLRRYGLLPSGSRPGERDRAAMIALR
jgi:Putative stress-induced transcription regulator